MSEENKAVMHRFYEEWVHRGNEDALEEIVDPECPLYFGGMFMGTGPECSMALKRSTFSVHSGTSTHVVPQSRARSGVALSYLGYREEVIGRRGARCYRSLPFD